VPWAEEVPCSTRRVSAVFWCVGRRACVAACCSAESRATAAPLSRNRASCASLCRAASCPGLKMLCAAPSLTPAAPRSLALRRRRAGVPRAAAASPGATAAEAEEGA